MVNFLLQNSPSAKVEITTVYWVIVEESIQPNVCYSL
jgi:hypothetical protein